MNLKPQYLKAVGSSMMLFVICGLCIVVLASCTNQSDGSSPSSNGDAAIQDDGSSSNAIDEMPGTRIEDMEIDLYNEYYFAMSEIDTSVEPPPWSSFIPMRYFLVKEIAESGSFEVLDDDFVDVAEILFDRNNGLWVRNSKELFVRNAQTNTINRLVSLSGDDGLFEFIAVDNSNNIWAGGLQTGLYRIDGQLNITQYTTDNSDLPTNSMTSIHIDRNDVIWIALWENEGVLKITEDNWTFYNSGNSGITGQNIWCLVTDENEDLWIGTGYDNEELSLMRFDGQDWEVMNPRNDQNEIIRGTVRKLYSDDNRIYVVSVHSVNSRFGSNELLTYDGISWNKVYDVPEEEAIADLNFDYNRQLVLVRTSQGIYELPL